VGNASLREAMRRGCAHSRGTAKLAISSTAAARNQLKLGPSTPRVGEGAVFTLGALNHGVCIQDRPGVVAGKVIASRSGPGPRGRPQQKPGRASTLDQARPGRGEGEHASRTAQHEQSRLAACGRPRRRSEPRSRIEPGISAINLVPQAASWRLRLTTAALPGKATA